MMTDGLLTLFGVALCFVAGWLARGIHNESLRLRVIDEEGLTQEDVEQIVAILRRPKLYDHEEEP